MPLIRSEYIDVSHKERSDNRPKAVAALYKYRNAALCSLKHLPQAIIQDTLFEVPIACRTLSASTFTLYAQLFYMPSFLVTGASRGIGLSIVRQLATRPASEVTTVFASARSLSNALAAVISEAQGRVEYVELDVTSHESAASACVAVTRSLHGSGLDVLINNAGVMPYTPGGIKNMFVSLGSAETCLNLTLCLGPTSMKSLISMWQALITRYKPFFLCLRRAM